VIRDNDTLRAFEREYATRVDRDRSFRRALEIFEGLWREAEALNPNFPDSDWERDIEPDLAVARVLNRVPPGG